MDKPVVGDASVQPEGPAVPRSSSPHPARPREAQSRPRPPQEAARTEPAGAPEAPGLTPARGPLPQRTPEDRGLSSVPSAARERGDPLSMAPHAPQPSACPLMPKTMSKGIFLGSQTGHVRINFQGCDRSTAGVGAPPGGTLSRGSPTSTLTPCSRRSHSPSLPSRIPPEGRQPGPGERGGCQPPAAWSRGLRQPGLRGAGGL